ncbi:hypothetical protein [Alteromonas facilis]|uniref:hypothetical protein n=1 Tax=Alteromonas facilis TaxID=2048004 RepID=UPI000C28F8E7|nr:hypothetical protein [Alteromonas facilis]
MAFEHYADIAKQHGIIVMMANAIGPNDSYISCGQSSVWSGQGETLSTMAEEEEGLTCIDTKNLQVCCHRYPFNL